MATGADLVRAARSYLGVPYLYGGKTPTGLDCSGLISLACRNLGVQLVDGSSNQIAACAPISVDEAWDIPGAMLWREGHNGLAVGDGTHTIEATRYPKDGVNEYGRSPRFTKAGLIPRIDYGKRARMWVNPAAGRVQPLYAPTGKAIKGFGVREPIKLPSGKLTAPFHAGVDISNAEGTPVRAAGAGTVIYAGEAGKGLAAGRSGLCVIVAHADHSATYYGHLSRVDVKVTGLVDVGQRIGLMGSTGNVTGPHLHFEHRPSASSTVTKDPVTWAKARGVDLGSEPEPEPDVEPETPAAHQEDDMRIISAPGRGVAVIGPGYYRLLRSDEEVAQARTLGLPLSEGNARQFDVWRSLATLGQLAGTADVLAALRAGAVDADDLLRVLPGAVADELRKRLTA